jgi:hypothetical protein
MGHLQGREKRDVARSRSYACRQVLYELVWTIPFHTLAVHLRCSHSQLRVWCTQLWIPIPGRRYWVRLSAGEHVERSPLPDLPVWMLRNAPELVIFRLPDRKEFYRFPLHPLVEQTRQALLHGELCSRGTLVAPRRSYLDLRVTRSSLERSLDCYNALVLEFEMRGYTVTIGQMLQDWTIVTVRGVRFGLSIRERVGSGGELTVYGPRVWTDAAKRLELRIREIVDDIETEARNQIGLVSADPGNIGPESVRAVC